MALNGTTAHAFSHILYKALLFMGAGAVLEVTGRRNLSDMGGLHKTMPVTLGLYMIGAFAISAVPLFSGFVSKSMVVSAAGESHRAGIFLALTLASAGTFLHTGLKLPYYMFFGRDRGLAAREPPSNMLVAMGLAAAVCIGIGVFPSLLYAQLPFPVEYAPYTVRHVLSTLGVLSFTALGFFTLLSHLDPEPTISLDTDWFYRRGLPTVMTLGYRVLVRVEGALTVAYEGFIRIVLLGTAARLRQVDASVVDRAAEGIGNSTAAVSQSLKLVVTGHAQHGGLLMAAGVLIAMAIALFARQ
jgi:multicomponent Na+:H+ antiporter subunit D